MRKEKQGISDYIDRLMTSYQEEREIKCPFCGEVQPNDDCQYPVTYWGEDGVCEKECVECEEKFFVEEFVSRSYTVGKSLDESGDIIEKE